MTRPLRVLVVLALLLASGGAAAAQACAGFGDVDLDDAACRNVEWIRNRSVTQGCAGPTAFCPAGIVTRLQMAAFANRLGSAITPDVHTTEDAENALALDPGVTFCTLDLPARPHVRTATVDAVLSASGSNVQYDAEVVGRANGAAPFASLSAGAHGMGGAATTGWQNARLQGNLVLPANAAGEVAVRVRGGPGVLTQARCQLRAVVVEHASLRPPKAVTLNALLASPWGLAFLPDGRMLVTQRAGSMVLLSADGTTIQAVLSGVPAVDSAGQGGLLDVAIDPDFDLATNPWIYWTFAEPGPSGSGTAGTAVARARLVGTTLQDLEVIFRQQPKLAGAGHYGSRLAFRSDKTLLVTLGERMYDNPASPTTQYAQNVANHLGKVVRIMRDGAVPQGNPGFGPTAQPQLWSIGHRNPQGAAIHPVTGELWLLEHGPQGGDELNRVVPGGNYGWPLRSYGCPYGSPVGEACRVGGGTHAPLFVEPAAYWVPTSIAPAGMTFYTGDKFPEWHGNVLFGALAGTAMWRVTLAGNAVGSRERLFANLGERIRNVRQGPDGWLYLLTDSGKLIRIDR